MTARLLLSLMFLTACSFAQVQNSPEPTITADEYEVYGAVIDFFMTKGIAQHPFIAYRTSDFECGSSRNGLSMSGCNGLRLSDETPEQRMKIVERDLPEIEARTISDFISKNSTTAVISDTLPTKHKYVMFGPAHADPMPPGWEHADFFYFSRVGFNAKQTQALISVSFMSGSNASNSGGKYLLLTKANGLWKRDGSSAVWELVPPQSAQVKHPL